MARAAIELSGDISPQMARLHRQIEGCAYNPDGPVLAFRVRSMAIVMHPDVIHIHRAEDESTAPQVMAWLWQLVEDPDCRLSHEGVLS